MSLATLVAVFAIMFLAAAVRSFLGFGDAVVAMPLLAFVVGVRTAAPLVGLVGVILAAILVIRLRRAVIGAVAIRLVTATAVGIPIGVIALARVPETWSRQVLGLVLVAYGLHRLLGSRPVTFSRRGWAWPFGFLAGCLGGAYNTSGPPVVIYASGQGWDPRQVRANLQGYFVFSSVMIAASHGVAGLWTSEVGLLLVVSLPAVATGLAVGTSTVRRTAPAVFERALLAAIALLGAILALTA